MKEPPPPDRERESTHIPYDMKKDMRRNHSVDLFRGSAISVGRPAEVHNDMNYK